MDWVLVGELILLPAVIGTVNRGAKWVALGEDFPSAFGPDLGFMGMGAWFVLAASGPMDLSWWTNATPFCATFLGTFFLWWGVGGWIAALACEKGKAAALQRYPLASTLLWWLGVLLGVSVLGSAAVTVLRAGP